MSKNDNTTENKQLSTPILFMIYNRPNTAQEVFNAIRKVRPKKLYVASDGPRIDRPQDVVLCQQSRDILKQIDWDCELHTRFLEENLGGCDPAVRSEIHWFFECESDGIILEDDIVPNSDFFYFCETLLEKYRDDKRVMMIGGYNPVSKLQKYDEADYYYSRWATIWGWATWRNAWEKFDTEFLGMREFIKNWYKDDYFKNSCEYQELYGYLYKYYSENPTEAPWDFQWCYTIEANKSLCIIPSVNLITNIGQYGYHSNDTEKKSPFLYLPTEHINVSSLRSPATVAPNKEMDTIRFNHYATCTVWRGRMMRAYHYMRMCKLPVYLIHRMVDKLQSIVLPK